MSRRARSRVGPKTTCSPSRAHDLRDGFEIMSWVLIVAAFIVGAAARLLTIDRGTPSIGAFIHVIMMAAVFLLIALPAGVAAGMGSALVARRWPRLGEVGSALRGLLPPRRRCGFSFTWGGIRRRGM